MTTCFREVAWCAAWWLVGVLAGAAVGAGFAAGTGIVAGVGVVAGAGAAAAAAGVVAVVVAVGTAGGGRGGGGGGGGRGGGRRRRHLGGECRRRNRGGRDRHRGGHRGDLTRPDGTLSRRPVRPQRQDGAEINVPDRGWQRHGHRLPVSGEQRERRRCLDHVQR